MYGRHSIEMETFSASTMFPSSRVNEDSRPENEAPQARVPSLQSLNSASQVPKSAPRMPTSPQVESVRYVNQFHALMERQRQTFDEERALWNTERMELYEKIAQLGDPCVDTKPFPPAKHHVRSKMALVQHRASEACGIRKAVVGPIT